MQLLLILLLVLTLQHGRKPPKPKPSPSPTPTATPTPTPAPLGDSWTTYNHDAHRSGASAGTLTSLTYLWRYRPVRDPWAEACSLHHAVATSQAIYARWFTCNEGASNVDKISLTGQRLWRAYSGLNWDKRHWPALSASGQQLYANDDRVFTVNTTTATTTYLGIDTWGEVLPTSTGFITVNMHHQVESDGFQQPDVWLGMFTPTLGQVWKTAFHTTAYGPDDLLGGALALNTGTVFRASVWASFDTAPLPPKGVEAFDAGSGVRRWSITTTPTSRLSVDDSKLYLIEGTTTHVSRSVDILTGTHLVARSQVDGSVVWSTPLTFPVTYSTWRANPDGTYTQVILRGTHVQAPVLANGLVIVATEQGVEAYSTATGIRAWVSPLTGATAKQDWGTGYTECATTTLAVALGSDTLVVTADMLYLLNLSDGTTLWHGIVPSVGKVRNPVIVATRVYVTDGTDSTNGGLIALESQ